MEILKHYVVLNQYTGLLINNKKQGIHFRYNYITYEFLTYLDDKEEGLAIELYSSTKNIHAVHYNKNNRLRRKSLSWDMHKKLISCANRLKGIYCHWYDTYLVAMI